MIHPAQRICYSAPNLYYAIGQTISCYDLQSRTGTSLWTASSLTAAEKGKNIRNRSVIEICIHGHHLIWISEDKMLRVLNTQTGTVESERELVKRGCSIDVASDTIVVGDKFGDVYQFPITAPTTSVVDVKDYSPVLGHVSMLTSVLLTPRDSAGKHAIVTADRDEHIRISNFPDGYNIRHFCLGHTQFVSALALTSEGVLISGGGDEYLKTWDVQTGQEGTQIALTEIVKDTQDANIGLTILKLKPITATTVVVLAAGVKYIYLYDITTGTLSMKISLEMPALDFSVISESEIIVSHDTTKSDSSTLFSQWQITSSDQQWSSSQMDVSHLNESSGRVVAEVEYTTTTSDLLRKRTKSEIEQARLDRLEAQAGHDNGETAPFDKDLKRAMDEDKAQTEKLMKKTKTS